MEACTRMHCMGAVLDAGSKGTVPEMRGSFETQLDKALTTQPLALEAPRRSPLTWPALEAQQDVPVIRTQSVHSTEDTAGVSAEVWSELAEFPGAIDGSTFEEFVSADDDVAIMGQLQDEDYVADVVPTTSQSDCNEEIDDGPLPTSSEVISAFALVRRYCVNMEGCGLSCSDSLDNAEACVLSQAAKSLKEKKIQDYFVPNTDKESGIIEGVEDDEEPELKGLSPDESDEELPSEPLPVPDT
ncbi:hypothetical protein HPB50_020783 [Hyalomma asiaticum]|uniref:Uncharacterized protein n=1 Tax=Hyalomma asiaticum TaxID=266040 RepID=A0ACB7TNF2_HYAAI|nr:hypothetical protein HPB50_020783 [Hyalomma asiaticum]